MAPSPVPTDELGTRRFESPERLPPDLQSTRYYLFEGGCVTYEFAFAGDASASLMFDADQALAFQPREPLVEWVEDGSGLSLCGAGVPRARVDRDRAGGGPSPAERDAT